MDLITVFKRLGYPKHSHRVYEVLTKGTEPMLVTTIALECAVSRVVVYRCLKHLLKNNLVVETTKKKRTYYSAGSPHLLK
jgi:DNA-binding transcriptional regulator GbsR (MarR family)